MIEYDLTEFTLHTTKNIFHIFLAIGMFIAKNPQLITELLIFHTSCDVMH